MNEDEKLQLPGRPFSTPAPVFDGDYTQMGSLFSIEGLEEIRRQEALLAEMVFLLMPCGSTIH